MSATGTYRCCWCGRRITVDLPWRGRPQGPQCPCNPNSWGNWVREPDAAEIAVAMKPGDACTVNSSGDLFMLVEARPFIGAPCVYVKTTKAGLAQVALAADTRRTLSVALRNVDRVTSPDPAAAEAPKGE